MPLSAQACTASAWAEPLSRAAALRAFPASFMRHAAVAMSPAAPADFFAA